MSCPDHIIFFQNISSPNIEKKLFAHINGQKYSYAELATNIEKLQQHFVDIGLSKGDRVVLSSKDDYYTSILFLALLRFGACTVFIDPDIPTIRSKAIIEKASAKGYAMDVSLFESREIDETAVRIQIEKPQQKKGKLFNRLLKNKKSENKSNTSNFPALLENISIGKLEITPVDKGDIAYVIFTSGTTSDPKGVMITFENMYSQLKTLRKVYDLKADARILNILMLYHVDGIFQGPLLSAFNCSSWIRPFQFDVSKIQDLFYSIYKYKISHLITVPTILSFLDKFSDDMEDSFQTDDFECIISVASNLEEKLWRGIEEKFQIELINVYGLTETVTGAIYCSRKKFPRKIGTIGIPIDCDAKIVNSTGEEVQTNETGELWLKGKNIFKGYFKLPEATKNTLKEDWLRTGDLASKDEEGFYTITGRSKNTINSGGINIYPEQISEMINTHPEVWDNLCIGMPDFTFGEKLVAAIQLKEHNSLDKFSLIEFLRTVLEQNQIPKEFYFFKELPKGISGKIQTQAVKQMILESTTTEELSEHSSYQSSIIKIASEVFGVPENQIQMKDHSNTLEGWDSMAHLVFVTELEKQFDLRFSTAEIITMNSLKATENILIEKRKG